MRAFLLGCHGLLLLSSAVSAQGPAWTYAQGPFAWGAVLAAHPSGAVFSASDGYLLISWDHGRTWEHQSLSAMTLRELKVLPDGDLLALGATGVLRSSDLGQTWVSAGLDGVALWNLALDPNGPWYAATGEALYRSEDEGATWALLFSENTPSNIIVRDLVVAESGAVLYTWGDPEFGTDLFRSTDGGQTWVEVSTASNTRGYPLVRTPDGSLLLASYEGSPDSFPTINFGAFESTNDGATWTRVYSWNAAGAYRTSDGELLVGAGDELVWDGPPLEASGIRSFVEAPDGTLFANSSTMSIYGMEGEHPPLYGSGSYRLEPGRTIWEQAGPHPARIHALATDSTGVLHAGAGDVLVRVEEGAWTATGRNAPVNDLLLLQDGRLAVARSFGYGSFILGDPDVAFELRECYNCGVAALEQAPTGTLLAATDEYGCCFGPDVLGIYRSEDGGETWAQVLEDAADVRVLASAPGMVHYAGTHGDAAGNPGEAVYRSEDDGLTWAPFVDGFTNPEVHALLALAEGAVYAGTEDGVFHSLDGAAWAHDGLPGLTVHAFAMSADGLLAGTSAGLYVRGGANTWAPYGGPRSARRTQPPRDDV